MADIHIEDFCKDAARILVQLFNQFPRPTSVYVEDIAGADHPDEYGLHSDRHMACFGTMLWLAEEGYIRYVDTVRQEAIDQATLTHKSLSLLSRISQDKHLLGDPVLCDQNTENTPEFTLPAEIAFEKKTNINLVRKAIASGSSTRIYRVMQTLILT